MKAIKWLGGIVAVLLVFIILAAVILPRVIDPNNYRDRISEAVYDSTGLNLKINGDISWSVFPWLGFAVNDIQVDDIKGQSLAKLHQAEASIKLLPLLSKSVEMSSIRLDGLTLDLKVDATGRGNWEAKTSPITTATHSTTRTDTSDSTDDDGTGSSDLSGLDIAGVQATNVNLQYQDQGTGQVINIKKASLTTGAIHAGNAFNIDAGMLIELDDPEIAAQISLKANVLPNPATQTYVLKELQLNLTPDRIQNPQTLSLTGNIKAVGDKVTGNINIPTLDLASLMTQLHQPLPALNGGDQVLRKVGVSTTLDYGSNALKLNQLELTLDDFNVTGQLAVSDIAKQALSFNLTGNDLVLDDYLPVATEEQSSAAGKENKTQSTSKSASKTKPAEDPVIIPVDMIKQLNLKGQMKLASLMVQGYRFDKPTLKLSANNGLAKLEQLNAGFYDGVIDLSAAADVRKVSTVSAKAKIQNIDLQKLGQQATQLDKFLGRANADMKLLARGVTQQQLTKTLDGEVSFNIAEGALLGTNFNELMCQAVAKVRKEEVTKTDWQDETRFNSLKGSMKINDGIARNRDLAAALDQLNLKGDGLVNLPTQSVDYHLGLTITGSSAESDDPACKINEKYADIAWPLRCNGKLGDRGLCNVDYQRLTNMAGDIAKKELQKKLNKKLEEKLGGDNQLKDALKGLFN